LSAILIHPEIKEALDTGRPIVALETAVVTHGLPRTPTKLPRELLIDGWNSAESTNLALARAMSRCVRSEGAIPAAIAIINGQLTIGITDEQLIQLAANTNAHKASSSSMASIMARGESAGTTVSATLNACSVVNSPKGATGRPDKADPCVLRFFATGGIGGAHRNWQQLPDISADLRALSHTPVCVVCAGAKSILDLPATLEMLESLGVPVVGFQTECFPQFQCAGDDSLKLSQRVDDVQTAARVCELHWSTLKSNSAVILAKQPPEEFAMKPADLERAIIAAESLATSRAIAGAARTPFLLEEIARQTQNHSLFANLALLIGNAKLAARIACAFHNK
jgi:pseudouridylate synthase